MESHCCYTRSRVSTHSGLRPVCLSSINLPGTLKLLLDGVPASGIASNFLATGTCPPDISCQNFRSDWPVIFVGSFINFSDNPRLHGSTSVPKVRWIFWENRKIVMVHLRLRYRHNALYSSKYFSFLDGGNIQVVCRYWLSVCVLTHCVAYINEREHFVLILEISFLPVYF